jgi:hypothetical protein
MYSVAYSKRFDDALLYAADVHRDQVRKGSGIPYVNHLLGVASIVGESGGSEDEVIAGLLHDAPEDHGGIERLEEIRERFGDQVAEIVAGCTDTYEEDKPEWWGRKRAYITHLADAPESVRLVSAADKLHNARAILADLRTSGEGLWGRFTGGRTGTLWYYRELVKTFQASGANAVVEELDRVVGEIEVLARQANGAPGPDSIEGTRTMTGLPHRRYPSEDQDVLFERAAPEAPDFDHVVRALHACIPSDGEQVGRDKLLMDAARELGYPKLTKEVRRALNKTLHAENNAGRLRTDWDHVWKPKA